VTSSYLDRKNPDLSGTLCRKVGFSDEFMTDTEEKPGPLVRILTNSVSCRLPERSKSSMSLESHIEEFRKYQDELYRIMNLPIIFLRQRELESSVNELGSPSGRLPAAPNKG
jgi:hypothetical protein